MARVEEQIIVSKPHGLHARPATVFVQLANKFNSFVKVEKDGEVIDGKSIIAILSLGVNSGAMVKLIVEGDDAHEALNELKYFLEREND